MDSVTKGEELVRYLIRSFVDFPDQVNVSGSIDEKGVLIKVKVNPDDLGRVIGKEGQTINAIRMVARALGQKENAFYHVKVAE